MKKIMLIGKTGSGKTTFCQAYKNQELIYKKTQAIDFMDELIDTPGEYIENRVYYKALIVTSNECDIIVSLMILLLMKVFYHQDLQVCLIKKLLDL